MVAIAAQDSVSVSGLAAVSNDRAKTKELCSTPAAAAHPRARRPVWLRRKEAASWLLRNFGPKCEFRLTLQFT
ncbi:pyridoxamine 5'-phosphate oxidase family protein [Mesorhizobium sp. M0051]|uniref:hypothetical protein n=1 Tax=unclassified Mesorhizobium TaxID=325217 RepID=UPI0004CF7583|nr:hypothetical protein [Mesorhizobium sp. LNHC252B00]